MPQKAKPPPRAGGKGLAFVCLGYWVEGPARIQNKVRLRPMERLTRQGW